MKTSEEEHRELWRELGTASMSLEKCECGSKAVMGYHPGCTFITCIKEGVTKLCGPDWCPGSLAREWNMMAAPMGQE